MGHRGAFFIFYSLVVCSKSSSPLGPFTQAVLSGGQPGWMASGRGRGRDFGALVATHGIISSHFLRGTGTWQV